MNVESKMAGNRENKNNDSEKFAQAILFPISQHHKNYIRTINNQDLLKCAVRGNKKHRNLLQEMTFLLPLTKNFNESRFLV